LVNFPDHSTWYRGGSREGTPDEWETVGSLDQHESVFGEVGVVSVPLKVASSDLNLQCPKRNIIKRREVSRCKCPGSGVQGGGVSDDEGEVSDRVREGGVSVPKKGKCGGCLDVPSFFFLPRSS
jgi:hypothetical protein